MIRLQTSLNVPSINKGRDLNAEDKGSYTPLNRKTDLNIDTAVTVYILSLTREFHLKQRSSWYKSDDEFQWKWLCKI